MSWIKRSQWNEMELKWIQRRRVFGYNKALYVISNNEDHGLNSIKVIDNENICRLKETILWNETRFVKLNFLHL